MSLQLNNLLRIISPMRAFKLFLSLMYVSKFCTYIQYPPHANFSVTFNTTVIDLSVLLLQLLIIRIVGIISITTMINADGNMCIYLYLSIFLRFLTYVGHIELLRLASIYSLQISSKECESFLLLVCCKILSPSCVQPSRISQ